jgi:hypothetical protein
MKDYKLTSAHYVIHLNERLYVWKPKGKTKPQKVFFAFLQKKGTAHARVEFLYVAPHIDYYTEPHKYNESQFNLCDWELQMEFWLDVLEQFCSHGDSVYCIFGGTKTMPVANVSFPPWF